MGTTSAAACRRVRILAALACAVGIALLLAPNLALAATFTSQTPAIGATVVGSPVAMSIAVEDTVPLLGNPVMLVDGVPRTATVAYAEITPGYYYFDEYDWEYYWIPGVYDYKRATISCTSGLLGDGSHAVSVLLSGSTAPTSTVWGFSVAEKPVLSSPIPASGTSTKTVSPAVSVKATDNSGVTTWTATIDGSRVNATYDAATKRLSLSPGSLANWASHTASVTVADAGGNATSTSWTFSVNVPETTWSGNRPSPGAVLTTPPVSVGVEVSCTAAVVVSTRMILLDGIPASFTGWIAAPDGNPRRGTLSASLGTAVKDGVHTITASISNVEGTTATHTWSYTIGAAPKLGTPSPAPGSTVTTTLPEITIPASDNSAVTSVTAVVNGVAVPGEYLTGSGLARVVLGAPLPDDGMTTVTVSAFDALGLCATRTWSFEVQAEPVMDGNVNDCYSCHPDIRDDRSMDPDCNWCHDGLHPGTPRSLHARADIPQCRPCHSSQLLVEHNRPGLTCVSCHNSTDPAIKLAIAVGDSACTSCHGDIGAAHYAVHSSTTASTTLAGTSSQCGDCHAANLITEHAKVTASSEASGCANCHPSPRDTVVGWDKTCVTAGCHKVGTAAEMHAGTAAAHTRPSSTDACFESGCHADKSLSALHATPGCGACHSAGKTPTGLCLTCHPERANPHGYDPADHTASSTCVLDCHTPIQSMTELKPLHFAASASFTCATCHAVKVDSIKPWDRTCAACHPSSELHPNAAASHVGTDTAYSDVSFFGNGCGTSASHTEMTNCHDISSVANLHSKLPDNGCSVCHSSPNTPKKECLDCHQVGGSTSYTPPGAVSSAMATSYPSSDNWITPGWTYTTTPAGQARYAVVNTPYPVSDTTRYVTVTTSTAGGVLFGINRATQLVPDNANIMQVTVYAKGKAVVGNQRKMQGLFRIGGQNYQIGNSSANLTTSFSTGAGIGLQSSGIIGYDYAREPLYGEAYFGNPKTGQRWTAAQLNGTDPTNSLEAFGVALTASAAANNVSLSQVYLRVSYYTREASQTWPTVGTSVYHHNNVKYLHNPADAGGKRFGVSPANGWYEALYAQDCYDYCHYGNGGAPTFTAKQGTWMWYSVGGDPYDAVAATRTLALTTITVPASSASLKFDTNYRLGTGAAGYVEISTNAGGSWTPLSGTVGGASMSSITGNAATWVAANYDLSAYAGRSVKLRFRYINGSSFAEGWAFDNLVISGGDGTVFSDDAETLKPDWTNTYWTRSKGAFPYE